jgi:ABC transporter substrate binding protein (PQQ-dependent alcohol dehydrogenase system)
MTRRLAPGDWVPKRLVLWRARGAVPLACLLLLAFCAPAGAQASRSLKLGYLDRAGDPAYAAAVGYTGVYRRDRYPTLPAAELALKDGAAAARAAGIDLALDRRTLADGENAVAAAETLVRIGVTAIILDLPLADMKQVALQLAGQPVTLINGRHRDDSLRLDACRSHLVHTMPSWSMLTDALAQGLLALDWRRVLVLQGPQEGDAQFAGQFAASAKKFGLRIVDTRPFVAGNDPRKRDQINVRLLTGNADYDAIFVADLVGDFARVLPYNTARARPVVGSTGLQAVAWHSYWERHGAPQLNRRFHRLSQRPMSEEDWATWIGVRMILDAAIAARDAAPAVVSKALFDAGLRLELYKALPGSIRPWSRQLRQTILLATADAVIAMAPVENALHQRNTLDTLGPDEPEFKCSH